MNRPHVILLVLLAVQALLLALLPSRPLEGDEPYYVGKARHYVEQRSIPRATPDHFAAVRGEGGNADWRPPGYPLFVAAVSLGDFAVEGLRARVTAVHFLLMAVACLAVLQVVPRRKTLAAVVLGIAPWHFAYASLIGPESLNATLSIFGLLCLMRGRIAAGSLLLSATLLLRPEMAAVAPVPIAVAVLQRRSVRAFVKAALCFAVVVCAQYAYRIHFTGQWSLSPFGPLRIYNEGAFAWANSWVGTEHEAYDFVYELAHGGTTRPLPDRAFADEEERRAVEELRAQVRRDGALTWETDGRFAELARKKKEAHPFSAVLLPRLWHTVHLWLNTETSQQLLHALSYVPRAVRLPLLAALLLLKLALLGAFFSGVRRQPLAASFVIARTLVVGLVLNWMVYRYMVAAALPLMLVSMSACTASRSSRPT